MSKNIFKNVIWLMMFTVGCTQVRLTNLIYVGGERQRAQEARGREMRRSKEEKGKRERETKKVGRKHRSDQSRGVSPQEEPQPIKNVLAKVWPPHIHRLTVGGQQASWRLGKPSSRHAFQALLSSSQGWFLANFK